jgi:hypothetical protein
VLINTYREAKPQSGRRLNCEALSVKFTVLICIVKTNNSKGLMVTV